MSEQRLRLVGYNVRDLLGDRDAAAHVVRSCRPDILCLQEAPRRRLDAHRLTRLAVETGLRLVAGGRGSGGTAVLAHPRLDVVAAHAARLPVAGRLTRTRGYALVTLAHPGGSTLTVASVHLPLRPDERLDHCSRVVVSLRKAGPPPYAVAADLNELPGGPSWTAWGDLVRDPAAEGGAAEPTFPSHGPRQRIDALLLSPDLRAPVVRVAGTAEGLDAEVLAAASDHLPLVADLDLT